MSAVLTDFLGAAATLTSLNLVFLGFIVTAFQNDDTTHRGMGPNRYRRLAVFSLIAFLIGIVCAAVCSIGLLEPVSRPLYDIAVATFFCQLGSLVALSVYAVVAML